MPSTTYTPEQILKAAHARHRAGDFYDSEHVIATAKAKSDLIARTWKSGREMSRDERRLHGRYTKTLSENTDANTARYLA